MGEIQVSIFLTVSMNNAAWQNLEYFKLENKNKWLSFSVITAVFITLLDIAELFYKTSIDKYGADEISL